MTSVTLSLLILLYNQVKGGGHMRTIKVFTKQFCPACTMTKNLFNQLNLEFQQIDVTNDPAANDALKYLGYTSLPVILVDENGQMTSWTGFRPDLIKQLV